MGDKERIQKRRCKTCRTILIIHKSFIFQSLKCTFFNLMVLYQEDACRFIISTILLNRGVLCHICTPYRHPHSSSFVPALSQHLTHFGQHSVVMWGLPPTTLNNPTWYTSLIPLTKLQVILAPLFKFNPNNSRPFLISTFKPRRKLTDHTPAWASLNLKCVSYNHMQKVNWKYTNN